MDKCMEKLLSLTMSDPQTETRRVTRLGLDVTVRELPYDEVERCGREGEDRDLHYLLAATVAPNFRDEAWYRGKLGCPTPIQALKKLFRHGEVKALVAVIDRLNGYRGAVLSNPEELENEAFFATAEALAKNAPGT